MSTRAQSILARIKHEAMILVGTPFPWANASERQKTFRRSVAYTVSGSPRERLPPTSGSTDSADMSRTTPWVRGCSQRCHSHSPYGSPARLSVQDAGQIQDTTDAGPRGLRRAARLRLHVSGVLPRKV